VQCCSSFCILQHVANDIHAANCDSLVLNEADVLIDLKFVRHGERDKDGNLIDLGRDITKERAAELGIEADDYDLIKAIGSDVGPQSGIEVGDVRGSIQAGRALETAHIFAQELPGRKGSTRARGVLAYNTIKSDVPYDHKEIYEANLPKDFESLEGDERVAAAARAQSAVMSHVANLNTPEAETYKKEVAGAFASTIEHFAAMAKRLKEGSRVLIPAGTHGGMIEFLLQQALVTYNEHGEKHIGFSNIDEIGGGLNPSESFTVEIRTNDEGELEEFKIHFDESSRPNFGDLSLDTGKLQELSEFYQSLHEQQNQPTQAT
jgi:hypothetical protein